MGGRTGANACFNRLLYMLLWLENNEVTMACGKGSKGTHSKVVTHNLPNL